MLHTIVIICFDTSLEMTAWAFVYHSYWYSWLPAAYSAGRFIGTYCLSIRSQHSRPYAMWTTKQNKPGSEIPAKRPQRDMTISEGPKMPSILFRTSPADTPTIIISSLPTSKNEHATTTRHLRSARTPLPQASSRVSLISPLRGCPTDHFTGPP